MDLSLALVPPSQMRICPLKKKEKKKVKKAPENSTRKLAKDQANISPQGSLKFNLILAESLHTASEWGVLIQPL